VLVDLDAGVGHEQRGRRPALVMSNATVVAHQRYPLVAVVPMSTAPLSGLLYPTISPGASGLRRPSVALVDQVRSVDKTRIRLRYGVVEPAELARVETGLREFLGLREQQRQA
jgi:mRNA interferase MazF